jgi:hypothetical protein
MSRTVRNSRNPGLTRLRGRTGAGLAVSILAVGWILASVCVHSLPHDLSDRAEAPLLPGADIPHEVAVVFEHACFNCHSEKTDWPAYSRLAPVSWLLENDVKRAREQLNLSRWDGLAENEQRTLLTAIATVIENREMPPHRYVVFHPEAKLSADDAARVIDWTHVERRRLRASTSNSSAR